MFITPLLHYLERHLAVPYAIKVACADAGQADYEWESQEAQFRLTSYGHSFWISCPTVWGPDLPAWVVGVIRAERVSPCPIPGQHRFPRFTFGHEKLQPTHGDPSGVNLDTRSTFLYDTGDRHYRAECNQWSHYILKNSWDPTAVARWHTFLHLENLFRAACNLNSDSEDHSEASD